MYRLVCLVLGVLSGFIPVPPVRDSSLASGRLALYRTFHPVLTEAVITGGACALCRLLFRRAGVLSALWAGLGALLARISPLHQRDDGGAASVYAAEIFFAPVWGVLSCAAGVGLSLLTGWEVLGALLPPALFILPADLFYGAEAGALALAAALLLAVHHREDLAFLIEGEDTGEDEDEEESAE